MKVLLTRLPFLLPLQLMCTCIYGERFLLGDRLNVCSGCGSDVDYGQSKRREEEDWSDERKCPVSWKLSE